MKRIIFGKKKKLNNVAVDLLVCNNNMRISVLQFRDWDIHVVGFEPKIET